VKGRLRALQLVVAAAIVAAAGGAWASGHAGPDLGPIFATLVVVSILFGGVPWLVSWWLLSRKRSGLVWFLGSASPGLTVAVVLFWGELFEPQAAYVFLALLPALAHQIKLLVSLNSRRL
jgi:hypothetical protein